MHGLCYSNVEKVREFIKSVYVDKKFFASKASGKPPRDTLVRYNILSLNK